MKDIDTERITGDEVRSRAKEAKYDALEELAREADINSQTIYRNTGAKKFGRRSTKKILGAIAKRMAAESA